MPRGVMVVLHVASGEQNACIAQQHVSGRAQDMPAQTVGASYGDALLAAVAAGLVPPDTDWTKIVATIRPRPGLADLYDRRYAVYRDLYAATRPLLSRLAIT